ncbi:alpha-hydroxy-acid oxidizing protein [Streptomyces sp. NRRL B-3648]|uniref:alpha-hydroxy-acid oxidizing protein n=1 Tax=Streptomyces sp. NRRL B-3648 TaxID=1519493 RepID=UPI001F3EC34C|nr:alpha-hydroxy-acid oxidizing protein [Streptomyces sp. NRRL B-3648]
MLPNSPRTSSAGCVSRPVCLWWSRECCGGNDAREFAAAGASELLGSYHGGRQLDGLVPPAWAPPEVVDAVTGTGTEVCVDGRLRRGTHVLSAVALGARAVFNEPPVLTGSPSRRLGRPAGPFPACATAPSARTNTRPSQRLTST